MLRPCVGVAVLVSLTLLVSCSKFATRQPGLDTSRRACEFLGLPRGNLSQVVTSCHERFLRAATTENWLKMCRGLAAHGPIGRNGPQNGKPGLDKLYALRDPTLDEAGSKVGSLQSPVLVNAGFGIHLSQSKSWVILPKTNLKVVSGTRGL